ncbi:MAG: SBBP repeat-containing protein, partial [Myxococcales bacterium]|nr:SBBP repeat-containing protein [Myxococcales bacterium]
LALALSACVGGSAGPGSDTDADADTDTAAQTETDPTDPTDPTTADTDETSDTAATTDDGEPSCGDGVREGEEACDGADLGSNTCASAGFVDGGELTCTDACTLDVSGCAACQEWFHELGGQGMDSGSAIHVDAANNVLVAGSTNWFIDGAWALGERDAFVTKYAADGAKLWTRTVGTSEDDRATALATDSAGAVYLAGTTEGAFDGFDNAGVRDAFLAKFAADGALLWTYQYGTLAGESPNGLAVDAQGNVFLTGSTGGDLDGNTSAGGSDVFLTKFDPDGDRLWTKLYGTSEHDNNGAYGSVAVDPDNNIIMVGTTSGALGGEWFGSGDSFVAKLDTDGAVLWIRQLGTPKSDSLTDLALDANGAIFVTGLTTGFLDGNPALGGLDVFVSKFTNDGVKEWTRQYGTASDDFGDGIALAGDGGFWLAGATRGEFGGNPVIGLIDVFIGRYDAYGVELWSTQFGTTSIDSLGDATSDAAGNLYAVGTTPASLFDQEHAGGDDLFVLRLCAE